MNKLYQKWVLVNLNQLLRHMSVAIATWLGTGFASDGVIHWRTLWIALISGAFFPTIIAVLAKGIPLDDKDITITETTTEKTEITHNDPKK